MKASDIQLDLMEFVEREILPRYNSFDKAHNLCHAQRVIVRSVMLARQTGADVNMAYAVAAYHDLGLEGPRAIHHLTSGRIVMADGRLQRWFSREQIRLMKEAVEDHRASASHAPRSIYGKIVAEADRDLEPQVVFQRTVDYGLDHYPEKSKEQQWERFREHMVGKYSEVGYIKLWIPHSPNEKSLRTIRDIIGDTVRLREAFEQAYDAAVKVENEK